MALNFNGTGIKKLNFNGSEVKKAYFNGTLIFTSEESFVPTWTLGGAGFENTNWGSWVLGKNDGTSFTGTATTTFDVEGHSKLRFTPNGTGWIAARSGGSITISINNESVFTMGQGTSRTDVLDLDISDYSGVITLKISMSATWGYTEMHNDISLLLYD